MPFTLEDTYTALKCLNLAPDDDIAVSQALLRLEQKSETLVEEVKNILTHVQVLDEAFTSETGSTNFALKQVDVLVYEQKQRTVGLLLQKLNLLQRLGTLLLIAPKVEHIHQMLRMLDVKHTNPVYPNARLLRG